MKVLPFLPSLYSPPLLPFILALNFSFTLSLSFALSLNYYKFVRSTQNFTVKLICNSKMLCGIMWKIIYKLTCKAKKQSVKFTEGKTERLSSSQFQI